MIPWSINVIVSVVVIISIKYGIGGEIIIKADYKSEGYGLGMV